MEANKLKELKLLCANVRIDILEMLMKFGQGHLGGSMSCVELFAVLYGKQLNVDPKNPKKEDRDQVVLSKGHAGPVWYSTLAERGFFPKDWLFTLNQGGTLLPSHPDRTKTPGVDMTTGSLGQGTSTAAGIATAMKKRGLNSYTYLIVGDGELNEGQCWEAFQYIANYKLNNCIVIIDDNKRQLDGYTKDVINPFSYQEKMKAFGFYTLTAKDSAVCMVLDSVKGQGVKFFEELLSNHSVKFNEEYTNEANKAIAQLKEYIAKEGE